MENEQRQEPVSFTVQLSTSSATREALEFGLRTVVAETLTQAGCLECRLLTDLLDPTEVVLVEEWRTEEDFHNYVRSATFLKLLGCVDLGESPPVFEIRTSQQTRGIEYLQKVRGI